MRKLILLTFLFLHGCTAISREAGYPGGNVGFVADRYTLFAKGQQQQVNRYIVALALVAPLIAETAQSPSDANISAKRIELLYKKIDALEKASKKCSLPVVGREAATIGAIAQELNCTEEDAKSEGGTALTFESISFEVNKALNDSLKQAFDNLDLRLNAERFLALDPREMLEASLRIRRLVPVLLRYLASYRDVAVTFGLSIIKSCKKDNVSGCEDVAKAYAMLVDRVRASDFDDARAERPIRDLFEAGETALNNGLNWKLDEVDRVSMLQQVGRACQKLDAYAKIDDSSFEGCALDKLLAKSGTNMSASEEAAMNIIENAKTD